jgi:hypothetical protein
VSLGCLGQIVVACKPSNSFWSSSWCHRFHDQLDTLVVLPLLDNRLEGSVAQSYLCCLIPHLLRSIPTTKFPRFWGGGCTNTADHHGRVTDGLAVHASEVVLKLDELSILLSHRDNITNMVVAPSGQDHSLLFQTIPGELAEDHISDPPAVGLTWLEESRVRINKLKKEITMNNFRTLSLHSHDESIEE